MVLLLHTLQHGSYTPIKVLQQCNALIVICVVVPSFVTLNAINIPLSNSNGQLHLENFAKLHLATIFICVTHSSIFIISSPRETATSGDIHPPYQSIDHSLAICPRTRVYLFCTSVCTRQSTKNVANVYRILNVK